MRFPLGACSFGSLLACLCCAASCGSAAEDGAWRFFPEASVTDEASSLPEKSLVFERSIGEHSLVDIGAMAVSKAGRLAVYQKAECSIAFFDIESGSPLQKVGRCGGGPAEYGFVSSLTFVGEELFAYDRSRRAIVVHAPDGRVTRRLLPEAFASRKLRDLAELASIGDGLLVSDAIDYSLKTDSTIAIVDADSGSLVRRFLPGLPPVRGGSRTIDFSVRVCGAPNGGETRVFAVSLWSLESMGFTPGGQRTWNAYTPIPWLRPHRDAQGLELPSGVVRAPVCAGEQVMLRVARLRPGHPETDDLGSGYLEIRGPKGSRVFSAEVPERANALWQRAVAHGSLWVFADDASDSPRLRVFRLRDRRPDDPSGLVLWAAEEHQ